MEIQDSSIDETALSYVLRRTFSCDDAGRLFWKRKLTVLEFNDELEDEDKSVVVERVLGNQCLVFRPWKEGENKFGYVKVVGQDYELKQGEYNESEMAKHIKCVKHRPIEGNCFIFVFIISKIVFIFFFLFLRFITD